MLSWQGDILMDVASFHFRRGEPIPLAKAQHNADGIHINQANEYSPPTWHYASECAEDCPQ